MLSLTHVRYEHKSPASTVVALQDIDLNVMGSEFVALLGPSGSGKTSLLNVASGLVAATAGDVRVGEQTLTGLDEAQRARVRLDHIGVVFQEGNLIPEFTAVENVELPLRARGRSRSDARAEALALLASVGLENLGGRKPSELSGGQQQRVGIARALAGERLLLLADEPTGSLDSTTSRAVFGLLREIAATGVAVVVATHDPLVHSYAHRVLTLLDGRIDTDEITTVAS